MYFYVHRPADWSGFDPDNAEVILFGAPFDGTQSYRPGARDGPSAVRMALPNIEFYSLDRDLEDLPIADIGDLDLTLDMDSFLKRVEGTVQEIRSMDKVPAVIGGEHTLTLASYRQFCGAKLVVLDAHLDLRDELYGLKISHCTFLRRLLEGCGSVDIIHIGGRAAVKEEWEYAKDKGLELYSVYGLGDASRRLKQLAESDENLYVSLDLDVLDPAFAPGVSTPEPGGITSRELFALLSKLEGVRLMGFDVVELTPRLDSSGITAVIAAKTTITLAAIACYDKNCL